MKELPDLTYIETTKLKLNPKNPRKNDAAVDTVAKSIEKYGFKNPLIADSNFVVYCGNTRLKAARKLKLATVPVIIADDLTTEQIRELALIDNKSGEIAEWDTDLLWEELGELDLSDFGDLDWGEPVGNSAESVEDDEYDAEAALEAIKEPVTKAGDIWQLGRHRLMCGDSTDEEAVKKLMGCERADLLLTDPPYNVDYTGKTRDKLTLKNDDMSDGEFRRFLVAAFKAADSVMKGGAAFYIWHADSNGLTVRQACGEAGWQVRQCLIWVKNVFVLGMQDYQWQHEPCLYGWKEGARHYFTDDRSQSTVWEEKKPNRNGEHPTMKPVPLMARAIENSTKAQGIVLDLFGGSGSTLIACEQLPVRKCRMMEFDEAYCDVIIKRWELLTGKKAVKIDCAEEEKQ